jgi:hypothetical protein
LNYSDASLDEMRSVGDAAVDHLVSEYFARRPDETGMLLGELFRTTRAPEGHPLVASAMRIIPSHAVGDPRIERGQGVFELFGPEILLILGSCALPLAYAAGNGARVVYRARRLKDDPIRRLCDTAQMVVNVMQRGQLAPGGVGFRAARKVRLIHALVRHRIQTDRGDPWNSAHWGTPINQEDQAGTLLTFSVAVLHGLRMMGAKISADDADAYVFAWSAIGRQLGVIDSLLPANEAEALALAARIGERQVRPTAEGRDLAKQTMQAVETLFPFRGYAAALTYFFLQDTPFGAMVAQTLALPEPNWTMRLVRLRAVQKGVVLSLLNSVPGARRRRSFVATRLVQKMILVKRPDGSAPFEVPDRFANRWAMSREG